jgi:hypothetical protein
MLAARRALVREVASDARGIEKIILGLQPGMVVEIAIRAPADMHFEHLEHYLLDLVDKIGDLACAHGRPLRVVRGHKFMIPQQPGQLRLALALREDP